MKAVKYLEQIEACDMKINNKLLEREQWLTLATKVNCSAEGERVQSSGNPDKVADAVVKMVEIDEAINNMIDDFIEVKQEVTDTINQLSDVKLIQVIHMKYVQYMSFADIALKMEYSYKWIVKIHSDGIKEIDAILAKKRH